MLHALVFLLLLVVSPAQWAARLTHGTWQQQVDHPDGKSTFDTWTYRFRSNGQVEGTSFGDVSVPFHGTWRVEQDGPDVVLRTHLEGRQGGFALPERAPLSGGEDRIRVGPIELTRMESGANCRPSWPRSGTGRLEERPRPWPGTGPAYRTRA